MDFVFLEGLQNLKQTKNSISTKKQNKNTKKITIKSKTKQEIQEKQRK